MGRRGVKEYRADEALQLILSDRDQSVLSGFLVSAALFIGISLATSPPPRAALEPYFDA